MDKIILCPNSNVHMPLLAACICAASPVCAHFHTCTCAHTYIGIVPVTCERLFAGIDEKDGSGEEFQVSLSMLEIYNEQVRDLLTHASGQKGGLKVRESQTKGFYGE